MKRLLLCSRCAKRSRERHRQGYTGEYVKHVDGVLRLTRPTHDVFVNGTPIPWTGPCVCDDCSQDMPKGSPATAVSIGRTGDYTPWESEYLEVTP